MPYSGPEDPSLPANVKRLPAVKRRQWVHIWNSTYEGCISDGGSTATCEANAFRNANGVVTMALQTRDFANVEIFAVGTWNGNKFTSKDLDNVVAAYNETKGDFNIPIKLGHNDKQKLLEEDGLPAAGWLENIKRVGNKLVGDFKAVPGKVADLIESGAFRKRSIELNPDFKIGDTVYPLVLTGIALLGSNLPAVEGLADIIKLYEREQLPHEDDAELLLFEVEHEETFEELMSALDDWATRAEKHFKGRPGAPTLRQLHRAFKEGLARARRQTNSKELTVDEKKVRELLGLDEDGDIEAAITALKTPAPPKGDNDGDLKQELSKAQAEILELQRENSTQKATRVVENAITEGRLLPRQRDTALKMALRDMGEFEEFVKTQPENLVPMGERGTNNDGGNYARLEPTQAERDAAKMLGVETNSEWRVNLMRSKAKLEGVELPADFGKVSA